MDIASVVLQILMQIPKYWFSIKKLHNSVKSRIKQSKKGIIDERVNFLNSMETFLWQLTVKILIYPTSVKTNLVVGWR